jgi:RNA polymerase sigma-70 factor (ECF subfamily)
MSPTDSFEALIARVRRGDAEAAAELVGRYETVIRARVRVWLRMQDARLQRAFDSMDVCQSVLGSFFIRATAGQYDLDQPEQLVGLLVRMARNKFQDQVSRQQAECRDLRRVSGDLGTVTQAAADSPFRQVAGQELLQQCLSRLSDEERRIAEGRAQGLDWACIAASLGGTPDGRRMQLSRAMDRVASELGLDKGDLA